VPRADIAEPDVAGAEVTRPSRPGRVLVAVAALVLVYLALSLLNDPRGYLGTDTGGKVATLQAMEASGNLTPDVGYWAEPWDPDGVLHPLYYTNHIGDRWVNVTTLPALYLGYPLFRLAGYPGALIVPMVGAALTALAARALVRRLSGNDERAGWRAFWIVGLASPVAIYALDFWEHAVGLALVGWAVVLMLDVLHSRRGLPAAAGAGLLLGSAATMRTEALVYAMVATGVTCLVLAVRARHLVRPILAGLAVLVGLALPLAANHAVEVTILGSGLRAERASATVSDASGAEAGRVEEAMLTATALHAALDPSSYLLGAVLLVLLASLSLSASQGEAGARVAGLAAAGVATMYLLRATDGLGFVPGLIAATPLAAVGLALGWREPPISKRSSAGCSARPVLAIALLALPLVWAFQFMGGAGPQWAGRYILPSGLLLGAVGIARLDLLARWARRALVGGSAAVTCFGLVWLSVRSHEVARTVDALSRRPEPVLVSNVAHLAREGGWFVADHRWLTASVAENARAAEVVRSAGFDAFALVGIDGDRPAPAITGWSAVGSDTLRYFSGVSLRITTFERTG